MDLWLIVGIIVGSIIVLLMIFCCIPYSPLKSEFNLIMDHILDEVNHSSGVFGENDIESLPEPMKKYFNYCGYLNKPKMTCIHAKYLDVPFVLDPSKPKLVIQYEHFNRWDKPSRNAFIDTSLYTIPFQGLDSYIDGIGAMRGVIGKMITLFDEKGPEMNQSSLVTWLAEIAILPTSAFCENVKWESIDDTHAKAIATLNEITVCGVFTFRENGEICSFRTDDRVSVDTNGIIKRVPWSLECTDYKLQNGYKVPTKYKVIWHYETGDLVYFESDNINIEYIL